MKLTKTDGFRSSYELAAIRQTRKLAKRQVEIDAKLEEANQELQAAKAALKLAKARQLKAEADAIIAEIEAEG